MFKRARLNLDGRFCSSMNIQCCVSKELRRVKSFLFQRVANPPKPPLAHPPYFFQFSLLMPRRASSPIFVSLNSRISVGSIFNRSLTALTLFGLPSSLQFRETNFIIYSSYGGMALPCCFLS